MWMSHLGTIKLEIELDDGKVLEADVPPLEAAFIELFSTKGSFLWLRDQQRTDLIYRRVDRDRLDIVARNY